MSSEYHCYVKIRESVDTEEFVELPTEKDGTILLSTLTGQYPDAIGVRFKSESGAWRAIRLHNGILDAPVESWGNNEYYITIHKKVSGNGNKVDSSNRRPTSLYDNTDAHNDSASKRRTSSPVQSKQLPAAASKTPYILNEDASNKSRNVSGIGNRLSSTKQRPMSAYDNRSARNDSASKRRSSPPVQSKQLPPAVSKFLSALNEDASNKSRNVSSSRNRSSKPAIPVRPTKKSLAAASTKRSNVSTQVDDNKHIHNNFTTKKAATQDKQKSLAASKVASSSDEMAPKNTIITQSGEEGRSQLCVPGTNQSTCEEVTSSMHTMAIEEKVLPVNQSNFDQLPPQQPCQHPLKSEQPQRQSHPTIVNQQQRQQQQKSLEGKKAVESDMLPENNCVKNKHFVEPTQDSSYLDASFTSNAQENTTRIEEQQVGNQINPEESQKQGLLQQEQEHSEKEMVVEGSTLPENNIENGHSVQPIQGSVPMVTIKESEEEMLLQRSKKHTKAWEENKAKKVAGSNTIQEKNSDERKHMSQPYTSRTQYHRLHDNSTDEDFACSTCALPNQMVTTEVVETTKEKVKNEQPSKPPKLLPKPEQEAPTVKDLTWKEVKQLRCILDPISYSVNWYDVGQFIFQGEKEMLEEVDQLHHAYAGGGSSGCALVNYLSYQSGCTVGKFIRVAECLERSDIAKCVEGCNRNLNFSDLDGNITKRISNLLNKSGRGISNWRDFAYELGCDDKVVGEFQNAVKEREQESPTEALLTLIKMSKPEYTLNEFSADLSKLGRNDVKLYIDKLITSFTTKL